MIFFGHFSLGDSLGLLGEPCGTLKANGLVARFFLGRLAFAIHEMRLRSDVLRPRARIASRINSVSLIANQTNRSLTIAQDKILMTHTVCV